jgi:hypothetical protein
MNNSSVSASKRDNISAPTDAQQVENFTHNGITHYATATENKE